MTRSSIAPSNFLELRGPTVPDAKDSIIDLPGFATPPTVTLTSATPDAAPTPQSYEPVPGPPPVAILSTKRSPLPLFTSPPSDSLSVPSSRPRSPPAEKPSPFSLDNPHKSSPPPPSLPLAEQQHSAATPSITLPSSSSSIPSPPPLPNSRPTIPSRPSLIRLHTQPQAGRTAIESNSETRARRPSDPLTPNSTASNESVVETSSVRALVVDDDPLTRRLMERMLHVRVSLLIFVSLLKGHCSSAHRVHRDDCRKWAACL